MSLAFLQSIDGPVFLALFWLSAAVLLAAAWRLVLGSTTPAARPAEAERYSPIGLACLSGGRSALLRPLSFKLWKDGHLEIRGEGAQARLYATGAPPAPADALEAAMIAACRGGATIAELEVGLAPLLKASAEQEREALVRDGLVHDSPGVGRQWLIALASLALPETVGILKLGLGLANQRPSAFLIVSLVALPLLWLIALRPGLRRRRTPAGQRLLRNAQSFSATASDDGASGPASAAVLAGLAIGNLAILSSSAAYDPFRTTIGAQYPGQSAGGGDSAISTSWASSSDTGSDSNGHSGDSGGSDSGGGCGGCGGGGD
jgi:uncharacterized protein (TIGR04222 family)